MPEQEISQEAMWRAVEQHDRAFDGQFYFGVLTTGVYCKPSCKCRMPLRKNVRFFENAEAAEGAGLRACKRCRPNEASPDSQRIRKLADHIRANFADSMTLAQMAAFAGLSPFHFQRSFKAVMGVTPRQFVEACRVEALKNGLRAKTPVTDAIYDAGFGSSSRVYEKTGTHLGMTPAEYRAGGKGMTISYAAADTALGRMMIGATDRGICFVQFADSDEKLQALLAAEYPAADLQPMPADSKIQFDVWIGELQRHLDGSEPRRDLPLDLRATAFQLKVWRYLQTIPFGSVKSYAEVAEDLGQPKAARAVARACATNRIALLIPCHRVIRGTGDLAGYKWGLDRKRALIDQERAASAQHNF